MTLIKSISGIRGTIGGPCGEGLTPVDIVKFTYAYCACLKKRLSSPSNGSRYKVVVGRDARISGEMVEQLVCGTLVSCGVDVVKCGLASTPTTELAVRFSGADGGIIITASHNPRQWNALKLLNEQGEFLSAAQGQEILALAESGDFDFAPVDELGKIEEHDFTDEHIDSVLALEAVDVEAVRKAGFKVVLDSINSVGGIIMPRLLEKLGVECITLFGEPTGDFAHNPEPLPSNLVDLSRTVVEQGADLGISVDPDVDRLAFICETGEPFVEEYTLVAVADYLLGLAEEKGVSPRYTVSNLSSSRALRDVTEAHGGKYFASAVGEVNVTTKMHEVGALIGGEGNGGVIYPASHCGRDAMVGVALFLSKLAHCGMKVSEYKATLPQYFIAKNKIELSDSSLIDKILYTLKERFSNEDINTIDGVKISFEASRRWVHLRRSNTEPIIRIYAEAPSREQAEELAREVISIAESCFPSEQAR
ncbi:MAG: phosphoglucosamine mutase [Candidatus Cryptobacteroides sp.]|nr:phosphoglucosamine mutase [Rikenellaceae bacterium]MDY5746361.1 phosphoglucosamine mutase [Candidatus Cryptobacteroides sp.]